MAKLTSNRRYILRLDKKCYSCSVSLDIWRLLQICRTQIEFEKGQSREKNPAFGLPTLPLPAADVGLRLFSSLLILENPTCGWKAQRICQTLLILSNDGQRWERNP